MATGAPSPVAVSIPSIETLVANAASLLQQALAEAAQAATAAGRTVGAVDLELARSNTRALAYVQAVGLHGAYRYLRDHIATQAVPNAATGAYLNGWLDTYGLERKPPAAAEGRVLGGGVAGAVLPTGTALQAGDGRRYMVLKADPVSAAGTVSAQVRAALDGVAGNLATGTLTLVSPVVGIDAGFTLSTAIAGGQDPESDADAQNRLRQRLSAEPMGGSPADYARWALAVPGITRAWGVRNPGGPGSAGVLIMADGNADPGLPTAAQRQAVIDYISDPRRGPPDELFVLIPTVRRIDFTIWMSPDTAAVRQSITTALRELFARASTPGRWLPHSHIREAISAAAGEYDHMVRSPRLSDGGRFVPVDFTELLVLGSVTFEPWGTPTEEDFGAGGA